MKAKAAILSKLRIIETFPALKLEHVIEPPAWHRPKGRGRFIYVESVPYKAIIRHGQEPVYVFRRVYAYWV